MSPLKIITVDQIPSDCSEPVDAKALEQARAIVDGIRSRGEAALIETGTKFGDLKEGEAYTCSKEDLKAAYDGLPKEHQEVLTRVVSLDFLHACGRGCAVKGMTLKGLQRIRVLLSHLREA